MARAVLGLVTGGVLALSMAFAPTVMADETWTAVPADALEDLAQSEALDLDTVYLDPDVDFSAYEKVYLEPVRVMFEDARKQERLFGSDERSLERDLTRAVTRALEDTVEFVEDAGEGVLIIELIITDATTNRDILGTSTTTRGGGSVNSRSVGIGGAAVEGLLIDGGSGDIVGVLSDDYQGRPFSSNTNLFTRWGDARAAFRRWGRELNDLVE